MPEMISMIHRGAGAVVEQQAEAMRWLSKRCHNLQREVLRLSIARDRWRPLMLPSC